MQYYYFITLRISAITVNTLSWMVKLNLFFLYFTFALYFLFYSIDKWTIHWFKKKKKKQKSTKIQSKTTWKMIIIGLIFLLLLFPVFMFFPIPFSSSVSWFSSYFSYFSLLLLLPCTSAPRLSFLLPFLTCFPWPFQVAHLRLLRIFY